MIIQIVDTVVVFKCSDGTRKLVIVQQGIHKEGEEVPLLYMFHIRSSGDILESTPGIFEKS